MKFLLSLTIFIIFLSGCSSAPVENAVKINSNSAENSVNSDNSVTDNSVADNSVADASNTNSPVLTMEEFMNANNAAPAANSEKSDLSGDPLKKNLRGRNNNPAPVDPNAETILTVAPDNSVVSTSMNKQGAPIETRTFKSHPTLVKVERVYNDLKNPTVKVYLKNGKTYDLPKEKVNDIFNVTANEILKAVGAAPSN